jgi:hypothetical protein
MTWRENYHDLITLPSQRHGTGTVAKEESSNAGAPHVPTAESSHRPKLVNATITASIQY